MLRHRSKSLVLLLLFFFTTYSCQKKHESFPTDLKVVIIRHAEKPDNGDNLSCKGFNRSLELADFLHKKYRDFSAIYVTEPNTGKSTTSARMFQTITPFAIKYNAEIDTKFASGQEKDLAKDLEKQSGIVLVVWNHSEIPKLVHELGIRKDRLDWPEDNYNMIWTITFSNHIPKLSIGSEELFPSDKCLF